MTSGRQGLNLPAFRPVAGRRFRPYDDETIIHYLKMKILGEEGEVNTIPSADVYASSPDKLPLGEFREDEHNDWFFFSSKSRDDDITVIDGGYYENDPDGAAPIAWKGKLIGYVKTLMFYQGSPPNGTETEWMVEEFRVNPEVIPVDKDDNSTQEKMASIVACKIFRIAATAGT